MSGMERGYIQSKAKENETISLGGLFGGLSPWIIIGVEGVYLVHFFAQSHFDHSGPLFLDVE